MEHIQKVVNKIDECNHLRMNNNNFYCKDCFLIKNEIDKWNNYSDRQRVDIAKKSLIREKNIIEEIPEGFYCYSELNIDLDSSIRIVKNCPFWGYNSDFSDENNGCCTYLNVCDWTNEQDSLLWDQCKQCEIHI